MSGRCEWDLMRDGVSADPGHCPNPRGHCAHHQDGGYCCWCGLLETS